MDRSFRAGHFCGVWSCQGRGCGAAVGAGHGCGCGNGFWQETGASDDFTIAQLQSGGLLDGHAECSVVLDVGFVGLASAPVGDVGRLHFMGRPVVDILVGVEVVIIEIEALGRQHMILRANCFSFIGCWSASRPLMLSVMWSSELSPHLWLRSWLWGESVLSSMVWTTDDYWSRCGRKTWFRSHNWVLDI